MKKCTFLISFALLASMILNAEPIPDGYYSSIEGKSDSVLKSTLCQIVGGGVRYEYGTTNYHTSSNPPQWEKGPTRRWLYLGYVFQ